MPANSTNPSVLITGGTRGLGLALAQSFLRRGHRVVVCSRSPEAVERVQREVPELHAFQADVSLYEERAKLIDKCEERIGHVGILVNNAALCRVQDFLRADRSVEAEIATNFTAPVEMCRALLAKPPSARPHAIVNISTGGAFIPLTRLPIYSATKAALHSFSQTLRHQLKPHGIKVIEVFPPTMDTELIKEIELAGPRPQDAKVIAGFADRTVAGVLAGKEVIVADLATAAALRLARIAPRAMAALANKAIRVRAEASP